MIKIKKGLNVPISGAPAQKITDSYSTKKAAIIGADFNGMKPTMNVKVGDKVSVGTPLFSDKKNPEVLYTSPASGTVTEVNRGEKRVFQSVVIDRSGDSFHSFSSYKSKAAGAYTSEEAKSLLLESGHWNNFRTRPFSKCPNPSDQVEEIFVTATDTSPLAADPNVIIDREKDSFNEGLALISHIAGSRLHVCTTINSKVTGRNVAKTLFTEFAGPHPAGNVGTHIHYISPVSAKKTVWHIGYQDVIAIGHLARTGKLKTERIIAIGGPRVKEPRLICVNIGACISEIAAQNQKDGENRVISGSVLSGRKAAGPFDYLGHFHSQIAIIAEGLEREFMGWQKPGFDKFTLSKAYLGKFVRKYFDFTSSQQGSLRAMVPIGSYEKVMPLDILPTQLLRSLLCGDTDQAQALGCLELDEEDLSLCTFVCHSKINYGPKLRENLDTIEKEG